MTRSKFYCQPCDHVTKALGTASPLCPFCGARMTDMGTQWRPGKKGRRGRIPGRGRRLETLSPQEWESRRRYRLPSLGEQLLAKLLDRVSGRK